MSSIESGMRATAIAILVNLALAIIKIFTGLVGNTYALIADGIESLTDVVSSFIVWSGLRIATIPPDESHPYGYGKAESLAGVMVAMALLGAAFTIAFQSIREIRAPHHTPAWYTLLVLLLVIITKEALFRIVRKIGTSLDSTSLKCDAWHHRSDALTSATAFVGILIALIGGQGYENADDWAALAVCGIIAFNGFSLMKPAIHEVLDGGVSPAIQSNIRKMAENVEGVRCIEKCRVRKSGLNLFMDIHVQVDGEISVTQGHEIGHRVKRHLLNSEMRIKDVIVHVEPVSEASNSHFDG